MSFKCIENGFKINKKLHCRKRPRIINKRLKRNYTKKKNNNKIIQNINYLFSYSIETHFKLNKHH